MKVSIYNTSMLYCFVFFTLLPLAPFSYFRNFCISSSCILKMESVDKEISALLVHGMLEFICFDSLLRESLMFLLWSGFWKDRDPSSPNVCSSLCWLSSVTATFLLPVLALIFLLSVSSSSSIMPGDSDAFL